MKKLLYPLLMVFCGLVVTGCADFAIPSKIQIKADPEFNLPLGIKLDISEYLDMDEILDNLKTSVPKLKIYKWTHNAIQIDKDDPTKTIDGTEVQTYLMRYPIANMPLDLSEYMQSGDNIELPPITVPNLGDLDSAIAGSYPIYVAEDGFYLLNSDIALIATTAGLPESTIKSQLGSTFHYADTEAEVPALASVDLTDSSLEISKWITDIEIDSGSGIKIADNTDLVGKIAMKIPALGVVDSGNGYVDAVADGTDGIKIVAATAPGPGSELLKEASGTVTNTEIKVWVKLTAIPEDDLDLSLVFKWTKAKVHPGATGTQTGSFPMPDLSDLTDMLGGLKFASIPAYLYVDGLSGTGHTMGLKSDNGTPSDPTDDTDILADTTVSLDKRFEFQTGHEPTGSSDIKTYDGVIPDASASVIPLEGLLNGDYTGDLAYKITVGTFDITNNPSDTGKIISIDILLVLPVYFAVDLSMADTAKIESDYTPFDIDGTQYIKLNLSMLDGISDITSGDLLESIRPTLDDFGKITKLSLGIDITKNDIFDGIFLGIKKGTEWEAISLSPDSLVSSLTFDNDEINGEDGLLLSFAILMEEDGSDSKKGALKLKPFGAGAGFDIKITAGAKIAVDATL